MLPGWQTEELAEEWIENEGSIASGMSSTRNSVPSMRWLMLSTKTGSHTQDGYPLDTKKYPQVSLETSSTSKHATGTVLIKPHVDQPGRVPLARRLGLVDKNMFSPLKLETMFQPTTPRLAPKEEAIEVSKSGLEDAPFQFNNDRTNRGYQFTFERPRVPPMPTNSAVDFNADNTKLRLFQFQYDTYTREHLSALIDSIPFDSSSRTTSTPSLRKRDGDDVSYAFRPYKRIKISPPDEEEVKRVRARRGPRLSLPTPTALKKDHFTEPRSLVQNGRVIRTSSNTTSNVLRSNASSTINASESARSYSTDELASKMRQVALVSAESDREGPQPAPVPVATEICEEILSRLSWTFELTLVAAGPPKGLSPALLANSHKLHDRLSRILDDKESGKGRKSQRFPSSATNITTIAPTDISPVPEQIGNMQFDKTALRWVKRAGEESDDPFRDIESVGGSKSNEQRQDYLTISIGESAQREIDALTGDLDHTGQMSPDKEEQQQGGVSGKVQFNTKGLLAVPPPESFSTPVGARVPPRSRSAAPTPIRSAMKTSTPVVVVHGPEPGSSTGKLRSVSFSDGRRSGRIRGLHQSADDEDTSNSQDVHPQSGFEEKRSLQPSFRTKRIADLLEDLEGETSQDEEEDQTPCKSSSQQRGMVGSLLGLSASGAGLATSLGASRSAIGRSAHGRNRDATFLTECSFGVAHDRLLQCITDVQPFEPYWEELGSIDLSGKGLDSLARLKEFMPKLQELIMCVSWSKQDERSSTDDFLDSDENVVGWLSGIPGGVRLLSAVSNQSVVKPQAAWSETENTEPKTD